MIVWLSIRPNFPRPYESHNAVMCIFVLLACLFPTIGNLRLERLYKALYYLIRATVFWESDSNGKPQVNPKSQNPRVLLKSIINHTTKPF
ncbi:conserved protein of unknown function [Pseudomonas marincola]|uniref:Uncharacterized protein n=1 Tax=Pseudomonas marincola TaxID=437900 RepID=A0A653EA23_9PSED|nr:conserved protein of unknown function [Pseudomonas marincola]